MAWAIILLLYYTWQRYIPMLTRLQEFVCLGVCVCKYDVYICPSRSKQCLYAISLILFFSESMILFLFHFHFYS